MNKRNKYMTGGISYLIFMFSLLVFVLIGWVMNIMDLVKMDLTLTGLCVLKIIGVFIPPLGAVMGWFF